MNPTQLRDVWLEFQVLHRCSLDRMLCNPAMRQAFLMAAREATQCEDEEQLLWGLVGMRKNKTLPSVLK